MQIMNNTELKNVVGGLQLTVRGLTGGGYTGGVTIGKKPGGPSAPTTHF